jgi:hypothetical protein
MAETHCLAAIIGGGRENVVRRRETVVVRSLERFLEFVEGVAAVFEDEAHVAQHVG